MKLFAPVCVSVPKLGYFGLPWISVIVNTTILDGFVTSEGAIL